VYAFVIKVFLLAAILLTTGSLAAGVRLARDEV
jgi:hypothetical protein